MMMELNSGDHLMNPSGGIKILLIKGIIPFNQQ